MRIVTKIIFAAGMLLAFSTPAQVPGQWVWMQGDSLGNIVQGALGVPDTNNSPASRYEPSWWTDLAGNFWLYGNCYGQFDDMWKFDPNNLTWTWMKGTYNSNTGPLVNYGVNGVPSPSNSPGGRAWGAMHWADKQGNFWLFGGYGFDVNGKYGLLSDLWRFDPFSLEWTWMAGSNLADELGNYGTNCVPASGNYPPPRAENKGTWVDNGGNLWLFGGAGNDYTRNLNGCYADMWVYDISTNQWAWISGAKGLLNNSTNTSTSIAARHTYAAFRFVDSLYIIGYGVNTCDGQYPGYRDPSMWKYDLTTSKWKYMNYGQVYPGNFFHPTACTRDIFTEELEMTALWPDSCGAWIMGSGNALWYYCVATNDYTFIKGYPRPWFNQLVPHSYGIKGVSSPNNLPADIFGCPSWKDSKGNFWLLNRGMMWRFTPDYNCVPNACPVIDDQLKANFIFNKKDSCAPYQTMFLNTSVSASNYYWNFGDGTSSSVKSPVHVYSIPANYTVELIACDSATCDTVRQVVKVFSTSKANFNFSISDVCLPSQVTAINLSVNADTNKWFLDGLLVSTAAGLQPQNIILSGTHSICLKTNAAHNCSDSLCSTFSVDKRAHASLNYYATQNCDPLIVNFFNLSTDASAYLWDIQGYGTTFSTDAWHIPFNNDGYYSVQLTAQTPMGCNDDTTVTITVDCDSTYIQVPNVFTPNADGLNSYFSLKIKGYTGVKILILDRWGKKVFNSDDAGKSWNGKTNDGAEDCSEGTYFYMIEAKGRKGEPKILKGYLTLLR